MSSKVWVGAMGGISCWLSTGICQAQCRIDNDCPGDQVCESDQCVAPSALPAPPPPPSAVAPPVAVPPASATPRASIAAEPLRDPPSVEPRKRGPRHSTAMMVVGIIMTSIGPIPLFMSMAYSIGNAGCRGNEYDDYSYCRNNDTAVYGTMLVGLGLIGAGVPMIVIGAKRRPAATARVTPWASPRAAGLSLRFDL